MDKKKLIIKIILTICIVVILIGIIIILTKNKKPIKVESKPINEKIKIEEIFEKIEQSEEIEILEENNDYIKEAEEIDFKKYNVLEKGAIVNTTEEKINETWVIKLGSLEQQEEVCRILGTRVQKLKNEFKDNKDQTDILNKAIIKQEDGVVIMIIAPNAEKIEEIIAKSMGA